MQPKKSLLQILKSNDFALWIAILSVIVQSFHSYTAFHNHSSLKDTGLGISQAILFAVVIDLAILFYTLRNRTGIALGAAGVMFVINAYYYFQHFGISFEFAFGCFLAAIIPASVYFYSEEIQPEGKTPLQAELDAVYRDRDMWKRKVDSLQDTLSIGKAQFNKVNDSLERSEKNAADLKKTNIELAELVKKLEKANEDWMPQDRGELIEWYNRRARIFNDKVPYGHSDKLVVLPNPYFGLDFGLKDITPSDKSLVNVSGDGVMDVEYEEDQHKPKEIINTSRPYHDDTSKIL